MFGKKLLEARKRKGFTLEQLADIYNKQFDGSLSKGTLSKYEHEKQEPMISTVGNLANILGVTVDYLIDDTDSIHIDSVSSLSKYGIRPIKTKKFPMLGEIACGKPIYCDEDYETYIEASEDIKADFCLTAKGDSMINARIFDGDIVFIKEQPIVENGEIAAIIIEDSATLKRVYLKSDKIILRPENPIYDDIIYEKDDMNRVHILGKAVAFQSSVR